MSLFSSEYSNFLDTHKKHQRAFSFMPYDCAVRVCRIIHSFTVCDVNPVPSHNLAFRKWANDKQHLTTLHNAHTIQATNQRYAFCVYAKSVTLRVFTHSDCHFDTWYLFMYSFYFCDILSFRQFSNENFVLKKTFRLNNNYRACELSRGGEIGRKGQI